MMTTPVWNVNRNASAAMRMTTPVASPTMPPALKEVLVSTPPRRSMTAPVGAAVGIAVGPLVAGVWVGKKV